MKLAALCRVLFTDPREFSDRVITMAESRVDRFRRKPDPGRLDSALLIRQLGDRLGQTLEGFLAEDPLREIENRVAARQAQLVNPAFGPPSFHNARAGLARLGYALCRALQPELVLETGVCYGVTSAFFLQALAVNGKGRLVSIDLPPLSPVEGASSGALVPDHLKSFWELRRGRIRRELPRLLSSLPSPGIFLHDSLHTFRNMTFEFQSVWPRLRAGGILLSDDVTFNGAFESFFQAHPPVFSAVDGTDSFGVAVKQP